EDIEVTASEGRVTLRGIVRSEEYDGLFRSVSKVRGVREVENQLKLKVRHGETTAAAHANGNGNGVHNGRPRLAPVRLLAVVTGSGLALYGANRRGPFGTAVSVVGLRMLRRGLSDAEAAHAGAR
ncbi:MAG TPA: BON domain-containing protein, partial [Pyrinomonadaceae bacterium]|nr:BON domain-containing protein [Pyrinomonadaceae bacterium]